MKTPRFAVLTMFFVNGALFANWVARIPEFQSKFDLSEGELGLVLLCGSVGVLVGLALTSSIIAQFGSRKVTTFGAVIMAVAGFLLTIMPHPLALGAGLLFMGAFQSAMDVAMNAQGVEVERRSQKPLMSSFHAAYSIGNVAGAAIGAGMAQLAVSLPVHFAIVSVVFGGLAVFASQSMLDIQSETSGKREAPFQIPARVLWPIGLIAFCSGLGEGSMGDWSAVYLKKIVGTEASVAAFGFAAFSIMMTIGRFSGDWLTSRIRSTRIVRFGGLIAGLGLLLAVLVPETPIVLLGFAAVGIGLANVIPLAFSAAGNTPGISSSRGLAGVATIGYAAFLAGPPLVGMIADALSLRVSLGMIAALVGLIFVFADAIQPRREAAQPVVVAGD